MNCPQPSSATRVFAVLGDPVAHSHSPLFQNAAFAAAELDAVYVALRCGVENLPGLLRGLARAGGGGNVTLPHKEVAARSVERATQAVRETGACNTFWLSDGEIWGDNTDVVGFACAVEYLLGASASGLRVLLVGAGGAARAALYTLLRDGVREVVVLNRTPAHAHELARRLDPAGERVSVVAALAAAGDAPFDLAVNASSVGLRSGDPLPLPDEFEPGAGLDLVYAPGGTPWVRRLRARGIPAEDGLEMLLQQGAAAFERWWGFSPSLEAMRSALSDT